VFALCFDHNFYVHSNLISDQMSLFSISKNFKNIWGSFCWFICGRLALCSFCFLCVLYFFYYMLNLWTITVKCKIYSATFLLFQSKKKKKTNIIKGKQKENGIEKFFIKFNFLRNYSLTLKLGISYFLGFVQYLPTPELEIFVGKVHWRQSQEHDRKKKMKNKFLAILDKK